MDKIKKFKNYNVCFEIDINENDKNNLNKYVLVNKKIIIIVTRVIW
jgi:hypothetical protein